MKWFDRAAQKPFRSTQSIPSLPFPRVCVVYPVGSAILSFVLGLMVRSIDLCARFQEVLHSALYSEAIIRIQPMLIHLTSAHEAGHVAAAYLTGLPVATYTLGEFIHTTRLSILLLNVKRMCEPTPIYCCTLLACFRRDTRTACCVPYRDTADVITITIG